jgi:hypothetical protein
MGVILGCGNVKTNVMCLIYVGCHVVRDFFSFIINVMNNEYGKITQLWYLRMENKYVDFDHRRGIGFDLGHPRAGEFDLGCQLASGFDPSHP